MGEGISFFFFFHSQKIKENYGLMLRDTTLVGWGACVAFHPEHLSLCVAVTDFLP